VVHHPVNLGADANVIKCFQLARGRYSWIFGDDDRPLPGVLARVVECLEREQPDLVYLPARWHAGDLTERAAKAPRPRSLAVAQPLGLTIKANANITFISSWVCSRQAYRRLATPPVPARHANTSLPQLEWHLTLLGRGGKFMSVADHWIVARSGNTGGYPVFEVFTTNFSRIVNDKLAGQPELRRFFLDHMLRCYLPVLVWGLRQGAIGRFDDVGGSRLMADLRRAWPESRLLVGLVGQIGQSSKPLAAASFVVSRVLARLWMSMKRLQRTGSVR
ncbi:MAG: glycosyltransferase, partial [Ramlibacter sp.]